MTTFVTFLINGFMSGIGAILAQAAGKIISYIPTKSQSERDKLYVHSHQLVQMQLGKTFDPDAYATLAGKLRDDIRAAGNSAAG